MVIAGSVRDAMIAHARAEFPNEACGLVASDGSRLLEFYPVRNADASPVHYLMDAQDQLRVMLAIEGRDLEMGAICHSHTHSRAYPSATDVNDAGVTLSFYPDTLYIIVSLADPEEPDVRAFRLDDGVIREEELALEAA